MFVSKSVAAESEKFKERACGTNSAVVRSRNIGWMDRWMDGEKKKGKRNTIIDSFPDVLEAGVSF